MTREQLAADVAGLAVDEVQSAYDFGDRIVLVTTAGAKVTVGNDELSEVVEVAEEPETVGLSTMSKKELAAFLVAAEQEVDPRANKAALLEQAEAYVASVEEPVQDGEEAT